MRFEVVVTVVISGGLAGMLGYVKGSEDGHRSATKYQEARLEDYECTYKPKHRECVDVTMPSGFKGEACRWTR